MASSARYLLLFFLVVAFCVGGWICHDALAAVARPPTVVAQNAPSPPDKNLPDYIPPTYTLGAPLNDPKSFDVDEFARLYFLDVVPSGAAHGVRIRDNADVRSLGMVKPKPDVVAWAMAR